ncbi:glucosaminidase domain-containing protein [Corallincola platygyrae]|uniref:Glucosaminidase domain-containing protein n=1 Tax=Corallincola platygyrae TaxID=1193278 RepID=A0ABW4XLI0_9GAMM
MPVFAEISDTKARKRAFFAYLAPYVEALNGRITQERLQILKMRDELESKGHLSNQTLYRLQAVAVAYRLDRFDLSVESLDALLKRLDILPLEFVLIQAANESGWGTSRFAREGNNLFGLWCFKKGCGLVPKHRDENAVHEVAAFSNMEQAISAYFKNLNTHPSYKHLRDLRFIAHQQGNLVEASSLFEGLTAYSERGEAYVDELQAMLRQNQGLIREVVTQ